MLKKIFYIFLIATILLSLTGCKKDSSEEIVPKQEAEQIEHTQPVISRVKTYAFFGLDTRPNSESSRSDVIMLIRLNPEQEDIKILSVYRDTLLDVDGLKKCNAAYSLGGANKAMRMLENNLDISVDGFMSADFKTVADIIDDLGGVDIDITEEEAYYANSYIKEMNKLYNENIADISSGSQHLNGIQAVAYSRIRYTEGWDYKRTERQRTVLSLIFQKFQKADNLVQKTVITRAFENIYTDMNENTAINLIQDISTYKCTDNAGFPKYKTGRSIEGQGDCVLPNDLTKNVKWLHEFLYDEENYEPSDKVKKINEQINMYI